jgi:hypothetical protein
MEPLIVPLCAREATDAGRFGPWHYRRLHWETASSVRFSISKPRQRYPWHRHPLPREVLIRRMRLEA